MAPALQLLLSAFALTAVMLSLPASHAQHVISSDGYYDAVPIVSNSISSDGQGNSDGSISSDGQGDTDGSIGSDRQGNIDGSIDSDGQQIGDNTITIDGPINSEGSGIYRSGHKINSWGVSSARDDGAVKAPVWGPHWQPRHVHIAYGNTSSEVVVTWSTLAFSGIRSSVEWGTDMFLLNRTTTGDTRLFVDGGAAKARQWIHRVHLTDLAPATTYFYHVGGRLGWSAVFGFRTIPAGTEGWKLRLAVYGDMGTINAKSLVRLQHEAHQGMYDAVLHVGDMAYNMDTDNGDMGDAFMEQIEPIAAYLPYMTCPGNHENAYDFSQYRNRFSMPNYQETESLYYSFDLGPVHFVSISTEVYYFRPNKLFRVHQQYQWLLKDLEAATTPEARAERPWIILFGHRPMYCSNNDNDDCTRPGTLTRVGLPVTHWYGLEPVLAKYGVDLSIWAHEHSYERLWPLYNYKVMNGTKEPYTNPRAPVHITTGSAGCQEHLDHFKPEQPEWSAHRIADYGYTRLTVRNKTHLHFEQVSDERGGQVTDSVMLVRERHESYSEYIPDLSGRLGTTGL